MKNIEQKEILKKVRPSVMWKGEPELGGWYTEKEISVVMEVLRESMDWNVGFSGAKKLKEFGEAFAKYIGTKFAIPINGGGTGLDMAMMCLNLEPGDEVVSCAINFPGTHLAIIGQGAKLILCEPDHRTFNIDPEDIVKRITKKTRAIVATHMNGLSVDMDTLLEIAEQYPNPKFGPLKIIGDAARSCGATYKGDKVGKKGWMNVFSFQRKKLITTLGEGGMITTDDPMVAEKIYRLHSFGGGEGWGTNYKMSKVQAAVGLVQLERLDEMNAARVKRARERTRLLEGVSELILPYEPPNYGHVYYVYTILLPYEWAGERRNQLKKILEDEYKIGCAIANLPTYKMNRLIKEHTKGQDVPLSEEIGDRLLCPSFHPLMTEEENMYIATAIQQAINKIKTT